MIRRALNVDSPSAVRTDFRACRRHAARAGSELSRFLLSTGWLTCLLAVPALAANVESAHLVELLHIDGTSSKGTWVGSANGRSLEIREADNMRTIPLEGLARIVFASATPKHTAESNSDGPVVFHLADGGRLSGSLIDPPQEGDALFGDTALGSVTRFPFDRLAGIQLDEADNFPRAHQALQEALADPLPGQDILISRELDEGKKLRGRLASLGKQEGLFDFDGRTRTFQTDKIYAVVLAASTAPTQTNSVTLILSDGSMISGALEHADASSIRMATSLGFVAELPIDGVRQMRITSPLVVYLSDLELEAQHIEGLAHRPWPIREDRNVAGGPIVMGSKTFERGLGVHSRTALSYKIDGSFEKFAATIGIDDSVRPRGSVIFRVLVGGNVLFDSGEVTGADPPRDVLIDVSGAKWLTLFVDFGEGLDVADHANWGDARLLKPLPQTQSANRQ